MAQTNYQKLLRALLLLSFGLSALFVILAKIYTIACSDVVIMYTAWPEVVEILINVLECGLYGIAYAFLIYAAYRFPEERLTKGVLIYGGSVLFKYMANYLVTWITDTGMSSEYLLENLSYVLIYTAIELLQAALVIILLCRTMKAYHEFVAHQQRVAANLPGTEVTVRTYVFPFRALLSWNNPLQKCALWSGIVVTVFKSVSRLIYDISYGFPTSVVDGLWMVIYYLLDVFAGFAVCLLITYLLMIFDSKENKKI